MIKWSKSFYFIVWEVNGIVILIFIISSIISIITIIIPSLTLKLGERKIGGLDVVRMQYIPSGSISFHPNISNIIPYHSS